MSTTSLWLKEPHDGLPRSRSEGRAEVVVIGGGVTGCSCALTLAERGVIGGNRDASLETEETDVEETTREVQTGSTRLSSNSSATGPR